MSALVEHELLIRSSQRGRDGMLNRQKAITIERQLACAARVRRGRAGRCGAVWVRCGPVHSCAILSVARRCAAPTAPPTPPPSCWFCLPRDEGGGCASVHAPLATGICQAQWMEWTEWIAKERYPRSLVVNLADTCIFPEPVGCAARRLAPARLVSTPSLRQTTGSAHTPWSQGYG